MPRLLLLAAIALVLYILIKRAKSAPPHKRRGEYIKLGLGVAVIVVIGLALTGRMHWVGVALTGALLVLRQLGPTLIRYLPMLSSLGSKSAHSQGQQSTVTTDILSMQLDHDSGKLQGEVLQGEFKGWRLQDMDRDQIQRLLDYCQREDVDSAQLLDSYIQQRFPDEDTTQQRSQADNDQGMSRKEALAVLGLGEDASDEEIVTAHRTLMQKLHPDRGGNDYLAAKINLAKDFLLGR